MYRKNRFSLNSEVMVKIYFYIRENFSEKRHLVLQYIFGFFLRAKQIFEPKFRDKLIQSPSFKHSTPPDQVDYKSSSNWFSSIFPNENARDPTWEEKSWKPKRRTCSKIETFSKQSVSEVKLAEYCGELYRYRLLGWRINFQVTGVFYLLLH